MAVLESRHSQQEFASRGRTVYERDIRPRLDARDEGKFVAIDIVTGAHEVDRDEHAATERLLAHHPDAQILRTPARRRHSVACNGDDAPGR